jgi:hypothetical protein
MFKVVQLPVWDGTVVCVVYYFVWDCTVQLSLMYNAMYKIVKLSVWGKYSCLFCTAACLGLLFSRLGWIVQLSVFYSAMLKVVQLSVWDTCNCLCYKVQCTVLYRDFTAVRKG